MGDNRRSEWDIIGEILALTQKGVRKTEILYQANMSFVQLQRYLSLLLKKSLLLEEEVINNNGVSSYQIYRTTSKGNDLLMNLNKTLSYLK